MNKKTGCFAYQLKNIKNENIYIHTNGNIWHAKHVCSK